MMMLCTTFIPRPDGSSLPAQRHRPTPARARRVASCKSRMCFCQKVPHVCELCPRMSGPSGHQFFLWHHTRCFRLRNLLSGERQQPQCSTAGRSIV
ncbi:hypothetical protein BGW80DRAFT_1346786, partial [Lactifluus volemus]